MKHAKIIGFVSIKGGVGKTTAVANIGAVLSHEYAKKTLIVDANLYGPNLALQFGFFEVQNSLHDVLEGTVKIEKAIYNITDNLDLLPASFNAREVDSSLLLTQLLTLRSKYDVILIDSSPSNTEHFSNIVRSSDEVFIVTTPDFVTLASTLQTLKVAKKNKTYVVGIILNKAHGKDYELDLGEMQKHTKVPVVSVLYEEDIVLKALSKSKPVYLMNPDSDTAIEYRKLAAALVGDRYRDNRIKTKFKNLFKPKVQQEDINRSIVMVSHY